MHEAGTDTQIVLQPFTPQTVDDYLPALIAMSSSIRGDYWQREHYLADLDRKWELSAAAFMGGELAGFLIISAKAESLHVNRIVVAPRFQGAGIGRVLIQKAAADCKASGKRWLTLKADSQNEGVVTFYRKLGFEETGRQEDLLLLRLKIAVTVAIHQPNFVPWIGYFYKISRCDVFVLLDDVQYTKNSFINRNKIKTANGPAWLTMPVVAGKLSQQINETRYFEQTKNAQKVKKTVEMNYRKAPFFSRYFESFSQCLGFESDLVSGFNTRLLQWLCVEFGITTPTVLASALDGIEGTSTDRLVNICKALGGDTYLSGTGGANYQEEEEFAGNGIRLTYSPFKHPVYEQLYGDFEPYMSAIDFLFNCGPACSAFFKQQTS
jgi:ribosomal protein S18 acetylase RimI-like enzyme